MTDNIVKDKSIGWAKMSGADILHIPYKILYQFGKSYLVEELLKENLKIHSHIFKTPHQNE